MQNTEIHTYSCCKILDLDSAQRFGFDEGCVCVFRLSSLFLLTPFHTCRKKINKGSFTVFYKSHSLFLFTINFEVGNQPSALSCIPIACLALCRRHRIFWLGGCCICFHLQVLLWQFHKYFTVTEWRNFGTTCQSCELQQLISTILISRMQVHWVVIELAAVISYWQFNSWSRHFASSPNQSKICTSI